MPRGALSRRAVSPGTTRASTTKATAPPAAPLRNTLRHPQLSVRAPPTKLPTEFPKYTNPERKPSAVVRYSRGMEVVTMGVLDTTRKAEEMPWSPRSTKSESKSRARRGTTRLERVKKAQPKVRVRFGP